MRDHSKLRAFELADELAISVYQVTANFPRCEQFGLTSQLRRGAVSIASNIVEGRSRSSTLDYVRFVEIAYGSARELEYQLTLAERLGFLRQGSGDKLIATATETSKVLGGLLRALRRPA
jgi:four helix bundle protein